MIRLRLLVTTTSVLFIHMANAAPLPDRGALALHSPGPELKWRLGGEVGERLEANIAQWLLDAPSANPGMLDMFRVRDRQPVPQLVPWAGEFAGKYLISAVQALQLTNSPALRDTVTRFVAELIATQSEDGYLGPFPKADRLRGNWDLWGHYHIMQGLLLWHQYAADEAAFTAVRRAADLICYTYLNQPRRVIDAGSPEMNMAVLHILVHLHRLTGEPRYLAMAREIEKDWERSGDYLRSGLAHTEFFKSPRPRWESLHDLQGLVELWRVTGDVRYRDAFLHHWRSIARYDRHNTGGFSSGEQATGNPWNPAPIETCCTVAWMALSVDALRLTGDPFVADELELALLNGGLGAQHPSGRWWTYNTPMDGTREASAHSIVFQARAGTPELNCCSVNGPRVIGSLAEWAVMRNARGITINWHGANEVATATPAGLPLRLRCETDYPRDGRVRWVVQPAPDAGEFTLRFRIPGWSRETKGTLNGQAITVPRGPAFLEVNRVWNSGDSIELTFDMALRYVPGDREAVGYASLYRGPLLLAFDPRHNQFDESQLPPIDLSKLDEALVISSHSAPPSTFVGKPWLFVDIPTAEGKIRLCDFANAGSTGLRYRSWLPVTKPLPPPPITRIPADGATVGSGQTTFRWTSKPGTLLRDYRIIATRDPAGHQPVAEFDPVTESRLILDDRAKSRLPSGQSLWWKVVARGPSGETESQPPLARFVFDPSKATPPEPEELVPAPDGTVVRAPLRGNPRPEFGRLERTSSFAASSGRDGASNGAVRLNGNEQMLVYALPEDFGETYAASIWVRINAFPSGRIGQVLSLWAGGMDDPLRLTIDGGKLFARIEAQGVFSTRGLTVKLGEWHHLAAVKAGAKLTVFFDGQARETIDVPPTINTTARLCAVGGNPNYSGNEFLAADFAGFEFLVRPLTAEEILERARN